VYNTPERTKNVIDGDGFDALLRELERTAEDYWNVGRDNAQLLALLIKSVGARRVLEVGTSNGYSTSGSPARSSRRPDRTRWRSSRSRTTPPVRPGRATTSGGPASTASSRWSRATPRAHHGLAGRPFDFVFLDAEKNEYAAYLRAVLPLVRDGGLIVGDDTLSLRDEMAEYVALTREHPDLESVEVPIDDGIIISRKRRRRA
jgi:predicted O-methyltransferase YrrM